MLFFVAAALPAVAPAGAAPLPRYAAEVEVPDRSAAARQAASRKGLERVLIRVTGLPRVAVVPAVAEALEQSERYYNRFLFVDERLLRFFFSPASVLQLVDRARLPLWPAKRPAAIAWLVVEQGGARQIVQEGHPLAAALVQQAQRRGLQVRLPLLDLRDQMLVQPAVVWSGAPLLLAEASRRYGAAVVLTARVSQRPDAGYAARFLAWRGGGGDFEAPAAAADMAAIGVAAADFLADGLARRHAIPWRPPHWLRLTVQGIATPLHYGGLLRYLEGLEFVMDVQVLALNQERLEISVQSRAEMERLSALLAADGHLSRSNQSLGNRLVWRGPPAAGEGWP